MRGILIGFVLLFILLLILPPVSALPVFSGAEGFGTETPAGRGGTVYKVTNLNPYGTGSLRECINAQGPRVCVFEVSGTIDITGHWQKGLPIKNPYITIAGQTAPSPGITVKGTILSITTHDVLVQHLRFRSGDAPYPDGPKPEYRDAIEIANSSVPPYNVVIDHCSLSWGIDETFSAWCPSYNNTIQWSIISEGLHYSLHPKGAHSMGLLVGPGPIEGPIKGMSIHHNLLAHNADRNPLISDDTETEIINNVIYDWMWGAGTNLGNCGYPSEQSTLSNVIGNYYEYGPSTQSSLYKGIRVHDCWSDAKVYVQGNIGPGRPNDTGDEWAIVHNNAGEQVKSATPALQPSGITTHSAMEAYNLVLANSGARPADRDPVDMRVVNDVRDGTGHVIDCVGPDPIYFPTGFSMGGTSNTIILAEDTPDYFGVAPYDDFCNGRQIEITSGTGSGQIRNITDYVSGNLTVTVDPDWNVVPDNTSYYRIIIDCTKNAGGWPVLAENYRELTLPNNPNGDDDIDGYTNLEEWLHNFSVQVEALPQDFCGDGTPYGRCSSNQPKYCDNGNLVDDCNSCDCPSGYDCQVDGSCQSVDVNPTALYHFDEGNGTTTADSSGYGSDGTIYGATWTNDSVSGYALEFDGVNDYVEIGTNNWNANQGSIELWAKIDSFGADHQYLFGHTTTPAFANRIQLYTNDTDGWLDLGLGDNHTRATNIEDLDLGTWYHIALTWDGTNYNVFVNGTSKANGSYTGLTTIASIADIGNDGNPSVRDEAFNGIIDEVRIYNRALSKEEILKHYNEVKADLNNDGDVDILDLGIIAGDFGKTSGFDPRADVVPNNEIDVFDVVFVASRFT
jgi:hypothetical protein